MHKVGVTPGPADYSPRRTEHSADRSHPGESPCRWSLTVRTERGRAFDFTGGVNGQKLHSVPGPGDYHPLHSRAGEGVRLGEAAWTMSDRPAYSLSKVRTARTIRVPPRRRAYPL